MSGIRASIGSSIKEGDRVWSQSEKQIISLIETNRTDGWLYCKAEEMAHAKPVSWCRKGLEAFWEGSLLLYMRQERKLPSCVWTALCLKLMPEVLVCSVLLESRVEDSVYSCSVHSAAFHAPNLTSCTGSFLSTALSLGPACRNCCLAVGLAGHRD